MSTDPERAGEAIDLTQPERDSSQENQFIQKVRELINDERIFYPDIWRVSIHGTVNEHPFSFDITEVNKEE